MENYFIHLIFDSVCDASRFIFEMCLITRTTAIKFEAIANSRLATTQNGSSPNPQKARLVFKFGAKTEMTNKFQAPSIATTDPIIEESETCFEILSVIRKAIKLSPNVNQHVAMAKPAKLATAFPPLK